MDRSPASDKSRANARPSAPLRRRRIHRRHSQIHSAIRTRQNDVSGSGKRVPISLLSSDGRARPGCRNQASTTWAVGLLPTHPPPPTDLQLALHDRIPSAEHFGQRRPRTVLRTSQATRPFSVPPFVQIPSDARQATSLLQAARSTLSVCDRLVRVPWAPWDVRYKGVLPPTA